MTWKQAKDLNTYFSKKIYGNTRKWNVGKHHELLHKLKSNYNEDRNSSVSSMVALKAQKT